MLTLLANFIATQMPKIERNMTAAIVNLASGIQSWEFIFILTFCKHCRNNVKIK
jgi:hypothetical protein